MRWPNVPIPHAPPSSPSKRALAAPLVLVALCVATMAGPRPGNAAQPPAWRVLEDKESEFTPRYYHGGAVFHDRLWIMGGLSSKSWHNDVWSSADGAAWIQETPAAAWSPRAKFEVLVFKNRLWLLGGLDDESTPEYLRNDVWSSADGRTWELATASAPWAGRSDFRAEVFHNELVVLGGAGRNGRLNDVWSSPDGVNWRCMTPAAPWAGRSEFVSVVHKNKLLISGGLYFRDDLKHSETRNGIYSAFPDVWASVDGEKWICINNHAPFGGRYGSELLSMGDQLLLMPGSEGADAPEVSGYLWASGDGADWYALSLPPREHRFDRRVCQPFVLFHDGIWAPGGVYPFWGSIRFHQHITVLEGDFAHPERWRRETNPPAKPLPGEPGFKLPD